MKNKHAYSTHITKSALERNPILNLFKVFSLTGTLSAGEITMSEFWFHPLPIGLENLVGLTVLCDLLSVHTQMLGNPLAHKKWKKGPFSLISFHQSKIPYKRRARAHNKQRQLRKTMERAAAEPLCSHSLPRKVLEDCKTVCLSRFLRKVLPNVKESLLSGRSDRAPRVRAASLANYARSQN